VKAIGIFLDNLHGFKFFKPGSFRDPVLPVIQQMPYISNISHIADLITQVKKIPVDDVKADKCPDIPQMHVTVYGWTAYIHSYLTGMYGFKPFLFAGQAVVNMKIIFHAAKIVNNFVWK